MANQRVLPLLPRLYSRRATDGLPRSLGHRRSVVFLTRPTPSPSLLFNADSTPGVCRPVSSKHYWTYAGKLRDGWIGRLKVVSLSIFSLFLSVSCRGSVNHARDRGMRGDILNRQTRSLDSSPPRAGRERPPILPLSLQTAPPRPPHALSRRPLSHLPLPLAPSQPNSEPPLPSSLLPLERARFACPLLSHLFVDPPRRIARVEPAENPRHLVPQLPHRQTRRDDRKLVQRPTRLLVAAASRIL